MELSARTFSGKAWHCLIFEAIDIFESLITVRVFEEADEDAFLYVHEPLEGLPLSESLDAERDI